VEALTDAIGLRALGLGARVVHVLDREVGFILVPLRVAGILAAAVGQQPQQPDLLAVEEGEDAIVEEIGGRDRRLAIVELGEGNPCVGIDKSLLVDAPKRLQVADIERILGPAITRMLALELPWASFSVLAFSSAASCASVSTRPSCALLASSALSRFFMVSKS
jgi:hypothetical protein